MSLSSISKRIPKYLPNLKKNFEDLFIATTNHELSNEQTVTVALAISYALKNELLVNHFKYDASIYLEPSNIVDIRAVTIMLTRNNIFYRTITQIGDASIKNTTLTFDDNLLSNINIDKIMLMMGLLGVSITNNCVYCIDFYTEKLLARGLPQTNIITIIKMASVLRALSDALEIESLRNYEFISRGEGI